MTHKVKALGLALVAVFALSAVGASAASAEFKADSYPATLTASAESEQVFTSSTGQVRCTTLTGDATLTEESAAITTTPAYTGCTAFVGESELKAKVTFNGCDYNFTTELTHIECPSGKNIIIEVTALNLKCYEVEPQTTSGITFTNTEVGSTSAVTIDAEVTGLAYIETGACGSGQTTNNATYTGTALITGEDPDTGSPIGVEKG